MKHQTLRDLAKYGAGLITADFLIGLWVIVKGLLPFEFFGISWNLRECLIWLVFDAALIVILVVYGWHIQDRARTRSERIYFRAAGVIFGAVALLHLSRIVFGWSLVVGGWTFPYWLNALGAAVTLLLSYLSFSFARPRGTR